MVALHKDRFRGRPRPGPRDNPASLHAIKAPGFDDVEIHHHAGVTRLFWAWVSTYLHAWTLKRSQV
jgi:hypothetical protein